MLFAIGDIHGHFAKLMDLMGHCRDFAAECGDSAHFVLLGDYVDRGPDSRGVLEFLARHPPHVAAIRGNHDDMMLRALTDQKAETVWHHNGGFETLDSYRAAHVSELPRAHFDLIRRLPLAIDDGLRLFVHAGIDPEHPDARDPDVLLWTRKHPADTATLPRFIIHGHTPTRNRKPDLRPNRLNLDTGAGYGAALTAAGFDEYSATPRCYLNHRGELTKLAASSAARPDQNL